MTRDFDATLLLGVAIDQLTLTSTVQRIMALCTAWRNDQRPRHVVTVNVDFLVNALAWRERAPPRHPELLEILRRADLVTADGMPLVWLSRLLGTPLRERVAGSDLVSALAETAVREGRSLYLLGGRDDAAQRAAEWLCQRYPGLEIAGVDAPFVHTEGTAALEAHARDADAAIVERINRLRPDILLIGFGNPKQELWFHRNRHRLHAGVSIGIGGTFEFLIGRVRRAPSWMQRSGTEWLYRISQDPRRLWKRYAVGLGKISVLSLVLLLRHHRRPRIIDGAPPTPTACLTLPAHFDLAAAQQLPTDATECRLDLSSLRRSDPATLAVFMRWLLRVQPRIEGLEHCALRPYLRACRLDDLLCQLAANSAQQTPLWVEDAMLRAGSRLAQTELDALNATLAAHPTKAIDLSGVHYIDFATWSALLRHGGPLHAPSASARASAKALKLPQSSPEV